MSFAKVSSLFFFFFVCFCYALQLQERFPAIIILYEIEIGCEVEVEIIAIEIKTFLILQRVMSCFCTFFENFFPSFRLHKLSPISYPFFIKYQMALESKRA